jgi:hypothetical protein
MPVLLAALDGPLRTPQVRTARWRAKAAPLQIRNKNWRMDAHVAVISLTRRRAQHAAPIREKATAGFGIRSLECQALVAEILRRSWSDRLRMTARKEGRQEKPANITSPYKPYNTISTE